MENIIWGVLLTLVAGLLVWLGVRHREKARQQYEADSRRCTAATTMTIESLEASEEEWWRENDDGSREPVRSTVYAPAFVYTVDGHTYRYASRRAASTYSVGQQVPGYYDPADPSCITENKPRRPILGGVGYFLCAAFLLVFAVMTFAGEVYFF